MLQQGRWTCGCARVWVKWHPGLAEPHLATQQLSQRVSIRPTTSPGVTLYNTSAGLLSLLLILSNERSAASLDQENPPAGVRGVRLHYLQTIPQSSELFSIKMQQLWYLNKGTWSLLLCGHKHGIQSEVGIKCPKWPANYRGNSIRTWSRQCLMTF